MCRRDAAFFFPPIGSSTLVDDGLSLVVFGFGVCEDVGL